MLTQTELELIVGRLRYLAHEGGAIEAAQIKLIGLDEIREAAGPRWPRLRERVRAGSLDILNKLLGPLDVVLPAGDGFLVILAESSPAHYQRRAAQMREALVGFYLGEDALAPLRPEVRNRSLTRDALTDLIAAGVRPDQAQQVRGRPLNADIARIGLYVAHDQRVGAQIIGPLVRQNSGARAGYDAEFILDGRHHGAQDFLSLDVALLDEALAAAHADGPACLYGVCVHASTLQHRRARDEYVHWWARAPEDLKRRLFLNVLEIEKGAPLISISEWAAALRPHVSRLSLNFHYSDHAIANIGSTGAWAAGFHLPIYAGAQRGPRAERLLTQVRFWAKTLRRQGMRLAVQGFQDHAFFQLSVACGVDYATGDALWPFTPADEAKPAVRHAHAGLEGNLALS